MMLSTRIINREIILNEEAVNVIVLENRLLYRNTVFAFQSGMPDEDFIFSENFKPFEFSKKGLFISDPMNIDFETKRLTNRIYSYLEQLSLSESQNLLLLAKEKINEFAQELASLCDFEIDYNPEFDTVSLLKLLAFRVNQKELSQLEQLALYLRMITQYLGISLFVINNLHLYFSKEEIEGFYEAIQSYHLKLLVFECIQPEYILNNEEYLIVDDDLCVIEKG